MQGRLENQIKTEKKIEQLLSDMPLVVSDYYLNFSASREFRSCKSYIEKLKRFLSWYAECNGIELKDVDCSKINDGDIARYMNKIEKKQVGDEWTYTSFSYRKQIYSILNSFFTFLDKKRMIEGNPVRLIEYPSKKDKVEHVFLQKSDLDNIVEAVINGAGTERAVNYQKGWKERDLAIVYMFILTGMRESALCEIDLDKVDLENNRLEVIDKEHSKNSYTIPAKLKRLLIDWLERREELLGDVECDALFISNQRKRINQGTVRTIINKYSEEALGKKVSPHRLRAAYGNMIYSKTHDIELTSRAMKHKDISTTRIYMENDEEKINNKVANLLGSMF